MPHLVLGIIIMLVGAAVMAGGLYARTQVARGHALSSVASSALLLLLGVIIAIAGIIVSMEPSATK